MGFDLSDEMVEFDFTVVVGVLEFGEAGREVLADDVFEMRGADDCLGQLFYIVHGSIK